MRKAWFLAVSGSIKVEKRLRLMLVAKLSNRCLVSG